MKYQRAISPTLMWRRENGQECNICPYFITNDEEYNEVSRAQLQARLKNPEELEKFNAKREKYEESKNANSGKRSAPNPAMAGMKVTGYTDDKMQYQCVCVATSGRSMCTSGSRVASRLGS